MESTLTRRRVIGGLTGIAAASCCGLPVKAFAAWINPIPAPPQDADIASYVMDEVRELYWVAIDERAALAVFETDGTGGKAWSRLHLAQMDGPRLSGGTRSLELAGSHLSRQHRILTT